MNGNNTNSNLQEKTQNSVDNCNEIKEAKTGENVEVIQTNIPDKSTYEIFGVKIRNESSYNLSNEITDLNIELNKQNIMIFIHIHVKVIHQQNNISIMQQEHLELQI